MDRLKKLSGMFPDEADCALITSDVNRRYFCGMKSSAGIILVLREKAYLLIDFRYIEKAVETVKNCEVILLENATKQLGELFEKHCVSKVLIESETMSVGELRSYEKRFGNIDFLSDDTLSGIITDIRSVKSEDEIEKIQKAQDIAERSLGKLIENDIREGVTERELALILNTYMLSDGAEDISFDTIVLFGENTSLPHGVPSDRKLKEGEFVLIDFGAVYEGYHSDMTRTLCFGEPSDEMREIYNIVLEAQKIGIENAKSGCKGCDLDKSARDYIDGKGYGAAFGHSLGHGVGMEIHESPNASTRSEAVLSDGMVVTIEPGIYLEKKFGVRIEDFVVINGSNCRNLTHFNKNLYVI